MKYFLLVSTFLIVLISCNENKVETTPNSYDKNIPITNSEAAQMESDANIAAELSLKFDAIQPLAATTGRKEYSDQAKEFNLKYKTIEDKYTDKKTEFTLLVGKYREQLQTNK